ncbi:LYR motif-containing protein 2 isoform X3 [Elephas maximus indicus]|uniref:LYR motif-containing protein 2 isoform X3 n=1 Tax=Elephas maximus indicus TaxID=99487 RepID=UPI0021170B67|nr:LYR motif-containing protein 2 isoform X3 [Elephas maximus indicus]
MATVETVLPVLQSCGKEQFIRRQQVLLLYRRILQAIRQVPNDCDRKYLKDWAREEFKRNKSATEEVRTRSWTQSG